MFLTAATRPGQPGTVNEDWVLATPDLLVVADGATARTDTGCRHGAAWYAQQLGARLLARTRPDHTLQWALTSAIADVADLHPGCDLSHPGTPSAAVAVVHVDDTRGLLRWLVLGDVTVTVDTGGDVIVVSDQRISAAAVAERAIVDRYPIGSPDKDAALLAMKHAELAARNTPVGYWIAAADPAAAAYALTGDVPLGLARRVAVLTDGAARYVDPFALGGWGDVLNVLQHSGPRWFIDRLVRAVEAADPVGVRYPRNKPSDDATAVYVDFTPSPALGHRSTAA